MKSVNCYSQGLMMSIGIRYPTTQQSTIWLRRRQNNLPSDIAKELAVSRPYVSQAQRIAEERIESLLRHTAKVNRLVLQNMSPEYGFAVGYCHAHDSLTYITYSHKMGVQVWFSHEGDCDSCDMRENCDKVLRNLAEEWELPLPKGLAPTELGEKLFNLIMRRLQWK
ncbi:MAG: hypothetical protein GQ580_05080 [Candidatus Thorarchaeota archaeon]|nr:hypothetical protein [Candidatus Thorarchaeota archaeon]